MNLNLPFKSNLKASADYLAKQMPSVSHNHPNPIETLSIEDIIHLQIYLEKLKNKKLQPKKYYSNNFLDTTTQNRANDIYNPIDKEVPIPIDWKLYNTYNETPIAPNRMEAGSRGAATTRFNKRSQQNFNTGNDNNYYNPYEYGARQDSLPTQNRPMVYDHIRNINVESDLIQREQTRYPGQRILSSMETDRFELLPFDPQNSKHIVWEDNMPRGGYPTRSDRLEY